ncbi:hypothetical protein kam1_2149 [Methylacidiphilum kamchatkense Kam1]|uniref:Uncharacterized protein n=1 Tax=Methylacidiphilum kamchatkense Kam1 TaxID=1202785 RepID=A0A516TQ31_9BACT|nr:hypothetical protein kam1_2149 [Methylacidiphilum kamchatkense Kam1]
MYVTHSQKNKDLHKRHLFWKIFLLVASLHLAIILSFFYSILLKNLLNQKHLISNSCLLLLPVSRQM